MKSTLALAMLIGLLAACSSTRQSHYYTLLGTSPASSNGEAIDYSLGIGPVNMPEALAHREVISLGEAQELIISSQHRWAGDLKLAVSRVLADDMSRLLHSGNVLPHPWDTRIRPDRQFNLVIERFIGQLGGDVELQVKWRLLDGDDHSVIVAGMENLSEPTAGSSYNAYVAALNEALNELARRLAGVARAHPMASGDG